VTIGKNPRLVKTVSWQTDDRMDLLKQRVFAREPRMQQTGRQLIRDTARPDHGQPFHRSAWVKLAAQLFV